MHVDTVTAKKLAERLKKLYGSSTSLSKDLYGTTPPSSLISCISYPKLSLGILVSEDDIEECYTSWDEDNMSFDDILSLRMKLVNARTIVSANFPRTGNGFYEKVLESGLSTNSVDVEVELKKVQTYFNFSRYLPFYGLNGWIKSYDIVTNPRIPKVVEDIVESGVKTETAVKLLYEKGFSDYYIARLLSLGIFGNKLDRKLVPSKWSITATHKILINHLKNKLSEYNSISNVYVFEKMYYGNYFINILFPGSLNFELIEAILPGSAYNLCYNFTIFGKDDVSGGYYAALLSFYEFLYRFRRKGNCITFRIVTRDYKTPLGVWVVREGIRRAFYNIVGKFDNLVEALQFIDRKIERYNIPISKLKSYSSILKQKPLSFFK